MVNAACKAPSTWCIVGALSREFFLEEKPHLKPSFQNVLGNQSSWSEGNPNSYTRFILAKTTNGPPC